MPKIVIALLTALLTSAGIGQLPNTLYMPAVSAPPPTATVAPTATLDDFATPTPTNTIEPGPTATPTHTTQPGPTATTQPSGPCPCDRDSLNCSSFSTQSQAQACMDWCISQGRGDIHNLDGNADGEACESLPGNFRVIR